ncbi:MAG: PHP domain-containing protein [candidate division WOR-3 bacterium]|nr:PHP domain-containing protein [candidate division WOR-3 bacterium]
MLRWFRADLHIHTCLSPCGDLTMSPLKILQKAYERGIDIIGICDHNSAENVQFAINASNLLDGASLTVLPGMEICSKEEVHIIGLFENAGDVLKMQDIVYQTLPAEKNNPKLFGEQIIANEYDEIEGYNERLLIRACNLSVKEIIEKIHELNGIAIASHIDREAYSIIGQLGFIPDDIELDGVEISTNLTAEDTRRILLDIKYPVIRSSDAHFLEEIGKATTSFFIDEPTIEEIKKALRDENGRKISYE